MSAPNAYSFVLIGQCTTKHPNKSGYLSLICHYWPAGNGEFRVKEVYLFILLINDRMISAPNDYSYWLDSIQQKRSHTMVISPSDSVWAESSETLDLLWHKCTQYEKKTTKYFTMNLFYIWLTKQWRTPPVREAMTHSNTRSRRPYPEWV